MQIGSSSGLGLMLSDGDNGPFYENIRKLLKDVSRLWRFSHCHCLVHIRKPNDHAIRRILIPSLHEFSSPNRTHIQAGLQTRLDSTSGNINFNNNVIYPQVTKVGSVGKCHTIYSSKLMGFINNNTIASEAELEFFNAIAQFVQYGEAPFSKCFQQPSNKEYRIG